MPLSTGATFAGFRIVRLLGAGGMGEVYLADHPRLPRREALKILPLDVSANSDYRARFSREADLASKLWHPNIVSVHDRGESNGQLWISMDYVDGVDAARLLASQHPKGMPVNQVVRIVTAIAGALDYAHKHRLLHRDVKPANIMLASEEDEQRVLLADFGIARYVDDISGLTDTNMTVGTIAYAAPEQLMGEEIDGRADEYALAATAYHLLTGSKIFPYSNAAVVISRHLNTPPPLLKDTHPELAALDPVLATALSKKPAGRFPGCTEFAHALAETNAAIHRRPSQTATLPAPRPKPATATPSGAPQGESAKRAPVPRLSRRRASIAVAATVSLVLVAATAWIVTQQPASEASHVTSPPATSTQQSLRFSSTAPSTITTSPAEATWGSSAPMPSSPVVETTVPSTTRVVPLAPRVYDTTESFTFVIPGGWVESDTSHLDYGSALLSKVIGPQPLPGQPPPVANDARIILGVLDKKLYASAESDNAKAAVRLGSDMGEFFMPYPGTRIDQETIPLGGNGLTGSASYYEVKFKDTSKSDGQVWTGVVGSIAPGAPPHRWWVVWLGTVNDPVNKAAAQALAESIRG